MVGFDFGEKVSQLCYYDRREGEPVSLPVKVGTGQYTFPNVLSKKPGEEEWHFGLEVEYFVEQQDEIPVENLYTLCLKQETVEVDGATWKVGELLGKFIGNALRILGVPDLVKSINGLMITTPVLTRPMVENIRVACREMGFPRNRCFLQDYEENLSHLEEELLEGNMEDFDRKILLSRKELSVLSAYYEQLSDMGETLQQNAARHQTEQEALLFGLFCEKAGRLYDMVQTLKEYSMQLREMHQTQIDIRQNEIMKVLTIVTTLFMPLTLIAGWYGMNFAHMPELTAPGGYGIICVVCLLLIAVEIWIFKKKGWFK
mgnify:CR=1 FL=1